MSTLPTSLLVTIGLSILWGVIVGLSVWSLTPDDDAHDRYGKVGLSAREAWIAFLVGWCVPSAALFTAWYLVHTLFWSPR